MGITPEHLCKIAQTSKGNIIDEMVEIPNGSRVFLEHWGEDQLVTIYDNVTLDTKVLKNPQAIVIGSDEYEDKPVAVLLRDEHEDIEVVIKNDEIKIQDGRL